MLIIKDNVDLRVLEKYGFKIITDPLFGSVCTDYNMAITLKDRTICNWDYMECMDLDKYNDTLYDLIKDDLVEKIGGER